MANREVSLGQIMELLEHNMECEKQRQDIRAKFAHLPEFSSVSRNNGAGTLSLEVDDIRRRYIRLDQKYFPKGVTPSEQEEIAKFLTYFEKEVAPIVTKTREMEDRLESLNPHILDLGEMVKTKLGNAPQSLAMLFEQLKIDEYFGFDDAEIAAAVRANPKLKAFFGVHLDAIHPPAAGAAQNLGKLIADKMRRQVSLEPLEHAVGDAYRQLKPSGISRINTYVEPSIKNKIYSAEEIDSFIEGLRSKNVFKTARAELVDAEMNYVRRFLERQNVQLVPDTASQALHALKSPLFTSDLPTYDRIEQFESFVRQIRGEMRIARASDAEIQAVTTKLLTAIETAENPATIQAALSEIAKIEGITPHFVKAHTHTQSVHKSAVGHLDFISALKSADKSIDWESAFDKRLVKHSSEEWGKEAAKLRGSVMDALPDGIDSRDQDAVRAAKKALWDSGADGQRMIRNAMDAELSRTLHGVAGNLESTVGADKALSTVLEGLGKGSAKEFVHNPHFNARNLATEGGYSAALREMLHTQAHELAHFQGIPVEEAMHARLTTIGMNADVAKAVSPLIMVSKESYEKGSAALAKLEEAHGIKANTFLKDANLPKGAKGIMGWIDGHRITAVVAAAVLGTAAFALAAMNGNKEGKDVGSGRAQSA